MKKTKYIEVLIRYPDDFLTENDLSGLAMLGNIFQEKVEAVVKREVVGKIMKEIKIPKIRIDNAQLKRIVLEKMAERLIEKEYQP